MTPIGEVVAQKNKQQRAEKPKEQSSGQKLIALDTAHTALSTYSGNTVGVKRTRLSPEPHTTPTTDTTALVTLRLRKSPRLTAISSKKQKLVTKRL